MSNHTLNVGTNIVHQCPDSQLGSTSNNITISPSTSSGTINQDDIRHSLTCILNRFTEIIQRTYIYACDNKKKKIVNGHDMKICVGELRATRKTGMTIYTDLQKIKDSEYDGVISGIQTMNMSLSNIVKRWGTSRFIDFLYVCFGKDYRTSILNNVDADLIVLLESQFHPLRYTMIDIADVASIKNKPRMDDLGDEYTVMNIIADSKTFDGFNVSSRYGESMHAQVNGMVVYIKNPKKKTAMFVTGVMDDMDIDLVNSAHINDKYMHCISAIPPEIDETSFINFLQCMNAKQWIVYNAPADMYAAYIGGFINLKMFKRQSLVAMSNEFVSRSLISKRDIILFLLLTAKMGRGTNRYIAYFLYDLMTVETASGNSRTDNVSHDTSEQTELLDNFTWKMHELFNYAIVDTATYMKKVGKLDSSKINMEQQICLMRASDSVKEKATAKLREVKSKSDDNGSKARQYLDGLLKIPFGIIRREAVMDIGDNIKVLFGEIMSSSPSLTSMVPVNATVQKNMNLMEIRHIIHNFMETDDTGLGRVAMVEDLTACLKKMNKKSVRTFYETTCTSACTVFGTPKANKLQLIEGIISTLATTEANDVPSTALVSAHRRLNKTHARTASDMDKVLKMFVSISTYMTSVSDTLNKAVYGHDAAKAQIMRVVGQWISGDQVGHCFGFEGVPGCGKTSLAKYGLANCLRDENGEPRPFAMIAIGGDANGSTLHGHGYTYVGSTWGSIVQILIDKQCMNPIIFIDELDKISKTENGRELVGILTHMLDPTQNDKFQDKYFAGVDIDLSKVLFVLSYNDPDQIDRILLDRIHRVKFAHLSMDDKIHIARNYTLPEIYADVGLTGSVDIPDEVVRFIVDNYTCEAGIRKLKEKLFEIVTELNLDMLTGTQPIACPITVTLDDVQHKHFKDYAPVIVTQVPTESRVGYATGMWANSQGQGGALPIEANFYPGGEFMRMKLTGQQGDVMQESMNIAMTLAYRLTSKSRIDELSKLYNTDVKHGVHVNAPGGSAKDGPSAGGCITVIVFSLLNNRPIRARFAATGEIQLDGKVTAIGGLDLKILGSLKAGVVDFCYPMENQREFDKFFKKHGETDMVKVARFHAVETIGELMNHMLEDEVSK